jgi:hypothetical protein
VRLRKGWSDEEGEERKGIQTYIQTDKPTILSMK